MNDLFHRFISEEKNLEDEFIQSIIEYETKIASLNLELGHPVYTYRGSSLLIVKEKILKEEHQRLKYQKEPITLVPSVFLNTWYEFWLTKQFRSRTFGKSLKRTNE